MIVFDIDGTLSIVGDRLKYLQETPKNWDAFYAACSEDLPNHNVFDLHDYIFETDDDYIIYVTGRRESCRDDTLKWLNRHSTHVIRSDYLRMRGQFDRPTLNLSDASYDKIKPILDRNTYLKELFIINHVNSE